MFNIRNLMGSIGSKAKMSIKKNENIGKDELIALLKTTPEAFAEYEKAYERFVLNGISDNFFEINSRQAVEQMADNDTIPQDEVVEKIIERITQELLLHTEVLYYDGKNLSFEHPGENIQISEFVTKEELSRIPEHLRPQLSAQCIKRDFDTASGIMLLETYYRYTQESDPKKKMDFYNHFRQGLDILDLDELTYSIIRMNQNSMGHWFPALVHACSNQSFFRIPKTKIVEVPITMLQLTHLDYCSLTPSTLQIVDKWVNAVFKPDVNLDYFIKTGTYSSKFDFRNEKVHGAKEVLEMGQYLLFIHFQALQMASPLSRPCIYGASTTTEWVMREFIPDKENNPTIYKGMPLHTEYRVFVDADRKLVLSCVPYWEPNTMKKRFEEGARRDNKHDLHDYYSYSIHEETLMNRYKENAGKVYLNIQKILPALELTGQWSIDIMQNGDEFWIIDMAKAENSTFYDSVPEKLRNRSNESWIPQLT